MRFPDCAGAFHLNQFSGTNVIDESVNWDRRRHQRVVPNALYIVDDSLRLILDRQPLDVFAGALAGTAAHIVKAARRQLSALQT
jgi:hypothetical protein